MATCTIVMAAIVATGGEATPVDFDTQIIPIFTKAGCNVGSCHGAAIGRGGFKLSLYGGDPANDYQAIVRELEGRRINLARPEDSLLRAKPVGLLAHGGGIRIESDSDAEQRLLAWLRQGAPRIRQRQVVSLDVQPRRLVIQELGQEIPLEATARYDDGTEEVVTQWTVFTPNDPAAVSIDSTTAVARIERRGQNVVIARFVNHVVPLQLIVPLSDQSVASTTPSRNFIDEYVNEMLATLRIPVSPAADDAVFLRRLYLDLTGTLPSPEQVEEFLNNSDSHKREHLVDTLMETDEFVDYWTFQFAKLLRIRSQPQDTQGALTFHNWLRDQIRNGTGYNTMARQLVTATGDSHEFGPANFYRTVAGAREQAEYVSELFMGARLRCANCHNHPLDQWTQDDYHGFAAIFANIERGRVIKVGKRGEITHPRTGEAAIPRIPGERFLEASQNGRQEFVGWLTDGSNPFFARAIVNRLWKHLMGRGLVEPADDMRATNPATHPRLLDHLADDFVANGFQLRHTLRLIATSAAYGRSSRTVAANEGDDRFYSHALIRPLEPEVLADALAEVSGVSDQYGNMPEGTRAVTLFDPKIPSDALDILGRCSREESCEAPGGSGGGGLTQKLHMLNGELINRKTSAKAGRVTQLLESGKNNQEIIGELYLRSLGRHPDTREQDFWMAQLNEVSSESVRREVLEDIVWALLSCREFATNH